MPGHGDAGDTQDRKGGTAVTYSVQVPPFPAGSGQWTGNSQPTPLSNNQFEPKPTAVQREVNAKAFTVIFTCGDRNRGNVKKMC
jgi:hypothetical protein